MSSKEVYIMRLKKHEIEIVFVLNKLKIKVIQN